MSNGPNQLTILSRTVPAEGTYVTDALNTGRLPAGARYIAAEAALTYGSGGTTIVVYLQTSMDNGATWIDIACFTFTTASKRQIHSVEAVSAQNATPVDGALSSNTVLNGVIGTLLRLKYVVTGTYVASTIKVNAALR